MAERVPQLTPERPHVPLAYRTSIDPGKPPIPAAYVRVAIRNMSAGSAFRCSAKLLKVELQDQTGWRTLPYQNVLDMTWANKPLNAGREVDLASDDVDILDIAHADEGSQELYIASLVPANYPSLMRMAGTYRFTWHCHVGQE